MKSNRFRIFLTVSAFVFCLGVPLYSDDSVPADETGKTDAAIDTATETTAENVKETVTEVSVEEGDTKIEKTEAKKQKKTKKKSAKQIQREKNNFSGWVEPRGRSIEEVYGSIKLRIRNKIGSFNVAIVDEEAKKSIPVLSTADEYTSSGLSYGW